MAFGTRHNEVYKIFRLHLFTDLLLLVSDISLPTHRNIIQGKTQRQREIYFGEASKQNFPLRSPYVAFPEPSCIWKVLHGDLCALPGPSDCVAPSEKVNDAEMSKACRPYRKIQIARPFLSPLTHQPRRKALRPGSPRGDAYRRAQRLCSLLALSLRPNSFVIITANRVLHCNADTPEEMHHWITLLQRSKGDTRVEGQEFIVRGDFPRRFPLCGLLLSRAVFPC